MKKCFKKLRLFIQEIKSFYVFYLKIDKSERDIVFYSEDIASYAYFEGVIDHLTTKENLKIYYITSDISDPILSQRRANITALYINSLLPFFMLYLDSKMILMTMPDLHQFHVRRSERGAHHVYLFHNIGSSFPVIRYGALFHYDTIFCVGPHHIGEIRRQEDIYDISRKNLIEFGYWRLEKVYSEYKDFIRTKRKPTTYKARILLGPSWGENSIFNLCGSRLIRILLQCDYEVIARPHPMTKIKDPWLIESLNNEFKDFDNYLFDDDISLLNSLFESDLLISDWSGLSYEYAFGTERPVLFLDVPQKVVNPKYKDLGIEPMDVGIRTRIGSVLGLHELEKTDSVITRLLKSKDVYVKSILKARNEFVYNFGNSSQAGSEFIRDFIK